MSGFNLKTVVKIENMDSVYARYIVVRVYGSCEFWLYGEYNDEQKAKDAAFEIGGIIFDAGENRGVKQNECNMGE